MHGYKKNRVRRVQSVKRSGYSNHVFRAKVNFMTENIVSFRAPGTSFINITRTSVNCCTQLSTDILLHVRILLYFRLYDIFISREPEGNNF